MSNPALLKMLRGSGGMQSFHVGGGGASARDQSRSVLFSGERFTFSAAKSDSAPDFSKKENREEKGKKRKKGDDDSGSDSDSGDDSGPHVGKGNTSGKNGFPARGSDGGLLRKRLSFNVMPLTPAPVVQTATARRTRRRSLASRMQIITTNQTRLKSRRLFCAHPV
jgi:hypothetical protein